MNSRAKKRILLDIKILQEMGVETDVVSMNNIVCKIKGPGDTVYSTGEWNISIIFPGEYPFKSPSIGFMDKIYHPNVDYNSGSVCLNVLNEEWQPIYTIKHIIDIFLPQLLTYPNPDDPLNIEAAELYRNNLGQFNRQVTLCIYKNGLKALSK